MSWRCDAFELVDASVLIGKTQSRGQFSRGARNEDLTSAAKRHDAGGLVNSESSDPSGDHLHLTGVYSGSDLQPDRLYGSAHVDGGPHGSRGTIEHREEPVTRSVDLGSTVTLENLPDRGVVTIEQSVPGCIAEGDGPVRRSSDVGHEDGGQDAFTYGRLAPSAPATPDEGHGRFVTEDPGVVPRWDVEDVAGPDVKLGAVVHSEACRAGDAEADVVELAACGSRGGIFHASLHVGSVFLWHRHAAGRKEYYGDRALVAQARSRRQTIR